MDGAEAHFPTRKAPVCGFPGNRLLQSNQSRIQGFFNSALQFIDFFTCSAALICRELWQIFQQGREHTSFSTDVLIA